MIADTHSLNIRWFLKAIRSISERSGKQSCMFGFAFVAVRETNVKHIKLLFKGLVYI